MTTENIPLTYKGRPLRRKDNFIYYGSMNDPYIVLIQVVDTKTVKDMQVATRLSVQLQRTDSTMKGRDMVSKRTEKESLFAAIDIASVWLDRALSAR